MEPGLFDASAFANIRYLEELYDKYLEDPASVSEEWKVAFRNFDSGGEAPPSLSGDEDELRIAMLIDAYRTYGHLMAKINPLSDEANKKTPWQLELKNLGFSDLDSDRLFPSCGLVTAETATLNKIVSILKETYCNRIGIEYMGTQNPLLERWIQDQIEPGRFNPALNIDEKRMILDNLSKSELFEKFLHTKYVGQKRFSIEGAETLIPVLATIIENGATIGINDFIIGMAHRGRLNVLSNILQKSYETIFSEFEERYLPGSFEGSGDVKYHKGFSSTITTTTGKTVTLNLCPNPSHLEAVNPVVEGIARALQVAKGEEGEESIAPILIHGDAAIAGQGIIYETLQLYNLDGYSTGGTLHLVINNQIGFTTSSEEGRSTRYCTDIARAFCAPVFHVNGEDPESCVYAAKLALAIRQKFKCDVFIDLNCYRKYGHNETDEPAFTQPREYLIIKEKQTVRELYRDDLIQQGVVERQVAETLELQFKEALSSALNNIQTIPKKSDHPPIETKSDHQAMITGSDTAVDRAVLEKVADALCRTPDSFTPHKKLENLFENRRAMVVGESLSPVDWGMGELLAYGTLLIEGFSVRLTGQDSARGTFSHRHARLSNQDDQQRYLPLRHLSDDQGRFDVINSPLSEYAALGFEYGYNLAAPRGLVLWEAQFGDFANGAQVIIDQFMVNGEQKWQQRNNLVLLLPHGYEGQGPEHSSARIERFLAMSADDNMYVVYPTTPAQLFHLLRRQVHGSLRKPLVVFTPKGLLRHPSCTSTIDTFTSGGFLDIIDQSNRTDSTTVVFCSGRIYYDLADERQSRNAADTALVRIEQLYPLNEDKLIEVISRYSGCHRYLWVQEEPENMGAWWFMRSHLERLLPSGKQLEFLGRPASAASATGSISLHKSQQSAIIDALFSSGDQAKASETRSQRP